MVHDYDYVDYIFHMKFFQSRIQPTHRFVGPIVNSKFEYN